MSNIDKHGLDFADLTEVFFLDSLILSAKNKRWRGIGANRRGVICVVFAKLGTEGISVVSMRPARLDERKLYVESLSQED